MAINPTLISPNAEEIHQLIKLLFFVARI